MPSRRNILSLSAAAVLAMALPLRAEQPYYHSARGAALGGYDTVAYFTAGQPVKGSMAHAVKWRGAIWYFASTANRAMFEANPTAYAPQFGGYCAYAVARGNTVGVDPESWYILDGKLYLTHNKVVRGLWEQDMSAHIVRAQTNWPTVLDD